MVFFGGSVLALDWMEPAGFACPDSPVPLHMPSLPAVGIVRENPRFGRVGQGCWESTFSVNLTSFSVSFLAPGM